MDIIAACRQPGSCRGAAGACRTAHKTVKRVIARHEACGSAPPHGPIFLSPAGLRPDRHAAGRIVRRTPAAPD